MTTEDVARDLDSIRAAFGVAKINYYGFSYGTYLGQVYATLFPSRVRRMVLDSTVDPTGVWYTDNVDQDYAFQGRMDAFYAWVASYDSIYHLGSTAAQVRAAWYRARNQLLANPVNGTIGPDEFDDTFLLGGYSDQLWPGLAQALSSYLNSGNTLDLIDQYQSYGVQNENEFAVYNAVQCSDVSWPRSWAFWTSDTEMIYQKAPFETWDNAWYNAACAFWPVHGAGRAAADQRHRTARHLDAAGHAGRGDSVRGRPGRAPAAALGPDGGGGGRRQPRAVLRAAAGRLRPGLRERLSRLRCPAAGGHPGWSMPPARPCLIPLQEARAPARVGWILCCG